MNRKNRYCCLLIPCDIKKKCDYFEIELQIKELKKIAPERIIYVSCNPSTQARDVALLKEKYQIVKRQAVDMFPHTMHVENVVLLKKISTE